MDESETSIRDRMTADLKDAMRSGDTLSRDVIRYVLAALKNAQIDAGRDLTPEEETAVLRRQQKQRLESIEQFKAGHRDDLVDKESAQLTVLERYLPAGMSDEELQLLANDIVSELGASGPRDMSKVMPVLMERAGNRADGRRISAAARQALGSS
jgi:uncharacterized protein YqeY